jgi:tetratricopeptide (TPR) repeat protein/O-antigen ligase
MLQQVAMIALLLLIILGGTNIRIIALTVRITFVVILIAALFIICSKRLKDVHLLLSPMDFGWLAFILGTGSTVIFSQLPRRSLEIWILTIGMQLPLAYAIFYVFRQRWPDRALYRGLLVVGGCLYAFAVVLTVSYFTRAFAMTAQGIQAPAFRLWDVLDNPSVLAMFIAISVPCIVGYLFNPLSCLERVGVVLWLVGAVIATIASGTRSGTIAAFIGVFAALLLAALAHPAQSLTKVQKWAATHRFTSGLLGLGVIAAAGAILFIQSIPNSHGTGADRLEHYRVALDTFLAHPLTGRGPGLFMLSEEHIHSTPPFPIVPHAHNLFLNIAADTGLLGLSGLLIFLGTAFYVCVTVWRAQPKRRPLLAGAIGGLVGFLASGLFELPTNQPGLFFVATALLMFIASGMPVVVRVPVWRVSLILVPIVGIILISIALLVPYSMLWEITYTNMVMARSDVVGTRLEAERLDSIINMDPSDPLVLLQSAYVWNRVANLSNESDALAKAIDRLERAIRFDPELGLHRINLSALYAKAGHKDEALQAAQIGTERSFADPVAWLNLGLRLEEAERPADAEGAYLKALSLQPDWKLTGFWQSSAVRQTTLAKYISQRNPETDTYIALIMDGDVARSSGKTDEALKFYEKALEVGNNDPYSNAVAQGLLALQKDDLTTAQTWFYNAATIGTNTVPSAWIYLGDIAQIQGNTLEMKNNYEKAYQFLTARGLEGLGTARSISYAVNSFWRFGLVSDYMPEVLILDINSEYAKRLKILAKLVASGNPAFAKDIYRSILRVNPDDKEALTALQLMGS